MRRLEGCLQNRILELLARRDDVQPVVEDVQIDDVPQNLIDIDRELQTVAGAKIGKPQHEFLAAVVDIAGHFGRRGGVASVGGKQTHDLKIVVSALAAAAGGGVVNRIPDADAVAVFVGPDPQFGQRRVGRAARERQNEPVAAGIPAGVRVAFEIIGFQIHHTDMDRRDVDGHQPPRLQRFGSVNGVCVPGGFAMTDRRFGWANHGGMCWGKRDRTNRSPCPYRSIAKPRVTEDAKTAVKTGATRRGSRCSTGGARSISPSRRSGEGEIGEETRPTGGFLPIQPPGPNRRVVPRADQAAVHHRQIHDAAVVPPQ